MAGETAAALVEECEAEWRETFDPRHIFRRVQLARFSRGTHQERETASRNQLAQRQAIRARQIVHLYHDSAAELHQIIGQRVERLASRGFREDSADTVATVFLHVLQV